MQIADFGAAGHVPSTPSRFAGWTAPLRAQPAGHFCGAAALILAAAVYCQAHAFLTDSPRVLFLFSLMWSCSSVAPWLLPLFVPLKGGVQHRAARALATVAAAWISSSFLWALLAGFDQATMTQGLYDRFPLVPAALAYLLLLRKPGAEAAEKEMRAADDCPPCPPHLIRYARSSGNYVELIVGERTLFWRQTMYGAERLLTGHGFLRIHRSFLVAARQVEGVRKEQGRLFVQMRGGTLLPVSRPFRHALTGALPPKPDAAAVRDSASTAATRDRGGARTVPMRWFGR